MIYVFNKNKIFSYFTALIIVLTLFAFHEKVIVDNNIELIKVSSNVTENLSNINEKQ